MPDQPPGMLILALAADPAHPPMVAVRRTDGGITTGWDGWPDDPGDRALLLYHPGRFPWSPQSFAVSRAVVRGEGREAALPVWLRERGLTVGRGLPGVVRALAPDTEGVEDPQYLVRALVEGAARVAARPGPAAPADHHAPTLRAAVERAPASPGVYRFLNARGETLYLGQSGNVRVRLRGHLRADPSGTRWADAVTVAVETTGTELEAVLLEHLALQAERPPFNRQVAVHARPRGAWRDETAVLFLPSREPRRVEVCLVAGDGRFHWERAPRRARVPRGLAARLAGALADPGGGWAPGAPGQPLDAGLAAALAELTLTWLVERGDHVTRLDPTKAAGQRALARRLRYALAQDPTEGRVVIP